MKKKKRRRTSQRRRWRRLQSPKKRPRSRHRLRKPRAKKRSRSLLCRRNVNVRTVTAAVPAVAVPAVFRTATATKETRRRVEAEKLVGFFCYDLLETSLNFLIFVSTEAEDKSAKKEEDEEGEEGEEEDKVETEEKKEEKKEEAENEKEEGEDLTKDITEAETVIDLASEEKEKEPRALHKTSSIFLRNLAPTITKAEVEAVRKINFNHTFG